MKCLILLALCAVTLFSVSDAHAQKKKKTPAKPVKLEPRNIESFVFKSDLWKTEIAAFEAAPENKKFGFKWQTASKKGLRSEGRGFQLLGIKAGEVVIVSNDGKEFAGISISFYNKGDNGEIDAGAFKSIATNVRAAISKKLAIQGKQEKVKSIVVIDRTTWEDAGTTFLLESSSSGKGMPEFLRLKVLSSSQADRAEKTAGRSSLRSNVVKDKETGEVYIDNIPMVDQGRKGYCACASAARIYQYYGRSTDQHEIAQLAGSSATRGTSIASMVESLKNVTGKLNSRVNILYEYPKTITESRSPIRDVVSGQKEIMRDVNSYQQLAKKNKKKAIVINGDKDYPRVSSKRHIPFANFYTQCDPETFREVMMEKNSYSRYLSKIREYIDQGIPVAWCLQLGLFKETGIPQLSGGHMRLIIGYNEDKEEIIYSDSWGAGHQKKSMDAGKAFSMSNALLVLPPTR